MIQVAFFGPHTFILCFESLTGALSLVRILVSLHLYCFACCGRSSLEVLGHVPETADMVEGAAAVLAESGTTDLFDVIHEPKSPPQVFSLSPSQMESWLRPNPGSSQLGRQAEDMQGERQEMIASPFRGQHDAVDFDFQGGSMEGGPGAMRHLPRAEHTSHPLQNEALQEGGRRGSYSRALFGPDSPVKIFGRPLAGNEHEEEDPCER